MIEYRPASPEDAADLAPRLRAADTAEIVRLSGVTTRTALLTSVLRSTEAWSVVIDGQVEGMFGHATDPLGRTAMIWALGSDLLPKHRFTLIKKMRRYLDEVQAEHGMLVNVIDDDNALAVELLRRLGFTFGAAMPAPGGGLARTFWRR